MGNNRMNLKTLKEITVIINYEVNDAHFKKQIDQVLTRIPQSYTWEFPSFSIYQNYAKGTFVDEDGVYFDVDEIYAKTSGNSDAILGVIAHELAHVFLMHAVEYTQNDGLKAEDEADALASRWGFSEEIKIFRQKFGPAYLVNAK